jgi:hypothetical protein
MCWWNYRLASDDAGSYGAIFTKQTDYNIANMIDLARIDSSSRGIFRGSISGDANNLNSYVTTAALTSQLWTFYCWQRTYADGKLFGYINGSLNSNPTDDTGILFDSSADLTLGGGAAGAIATGYNAYISGLLLFNKSLNQSEIDYLYNGGSGRRLSFVVPTNNFTVTASDYFTGAAIQSFNVSINGSVYSTSSGEVITGIDASAGSFVVVVDSLNYYNRSYSHNVAANLDAVLYKTVLNVSFMGNRSVSGVSFVNNLNYSLFTDFCFGSVVLGRVVNGVNDHNVSVVCVNNQSLFSGNISRNVSG